MTTELMRYGRYRFLLYKKWDYARNTRTREQQEALDAGKELFKAANIEHWASQPELVARVQTFLIDSFPAYRPSPCGESPKNIIDALCRELRSGDVVIVRAEPAYMPTTVSSRPVSSTTTLTTGTLPNAPAATRPGRKHTKMT